MKLINVQWALFALLLISSSCVKAYQISENSSLPVSGTVGFTAYAGSVYETRSTFPDESMDRITDLNMFLYRGGILCRGSSVYASGGLFNVLLPDINAEYDIYLVANVGDVRDVVERDCLYREDMESWVYDLGDYSRFRENGVPMAGSLEAWRVGDDTGISLTRLVSRIDIRFVNSSEYDVSVRSMRLCHSARKTGPFCGGYRALSAEDVFADELLDDSLTADDIDAAVNEGATVHMYCLENMQGDLMPWNTDPKLKSIHNIPTDRSDVVTYFEVEALVSSDDVRWENVMYRFCLGRDVTGNFDVPRNCILGYTLDFASTPYDTGWTIEPDDPLYPGDIMVYEDLSPYYPGWDVFTFPEASPGVPVSIHSQWGDFTVDGQGASISGGDVSGLCSPIIVVGSQVFVQCATGYALECSAPDMHSSRLDVTQEKDSLSYVLAARNARGETVRVDYLAAGEDYGLYLCPWSNRTQRIVDWTETFFPEAVMDLVGRAKVMEYSRNRTNVEMYENEGSGDGDSGYRFYANEVSYGINSNCGQPYLEISAPRDLCCLAYKIEIGDCSTMYNDISVFDDASVADRYVLPEVIIDNTCGNLCASRNDGVYTVHVDDTSTPYWPCVRNLRSRAYTYINRGRMSLSVDEQTKDIILHLNEYSCGEAAVRTCFWDYDTPPSGYYTLPMKIYLDVTYVPKFGILRYGGSYGTEQFSGASVVREGAYTSVSSRVWGYQYLPARRDSYYRGGLNPSSQEDGLLEIIGNMAPSIVARRRDPGFPETRGMVALFNAGSVMDNEDCPSTAGEMPNGGSVFFCDPISATPTLWTLGYNAKVMDPMYRYMFTPLTSREYLDRAASYRLDDCSRADPVWGGEDGGSADIMHAELYGGVMVNYHLMHSTCLELLTGAWDRY